MVSRAPLVLAAALASVSFIPHAALAAPDTLAADVEALLDKSYAEDGPGAAVVVTENGKVIYSGGQGVANLETGAQVTPDTVFRFASITKQFAAAVILQLADEGKLSLDDPLAKFLPDYPGAGKEVTVRQLLNHTSGIQSYTGIPGWMGEVNTQKAFTTAELIAEFSDQPMEFEPGSNFNYNNSGYVLIGAIIETVTGKTWDQAIVDRISAPLGLTTIASFEDEASVPNMAIGYSVRGEDGAFRLSQKVHAQVPHAAGALRGNVLDMASWANALHSGKVLSQTSYTAMNSPTVLPDGTDIDYGYGMGQSDVRGAKAFGHSGGVFGFSTDSVYLPEHDVFVAVFANSDAPQTSPGMVMNRIAAMAIENPYPEFSQVEVDMAAVEPLLGVYQINGEDTRQFFARDGKFYTLRSGGSESEVFPAGGNRFFYGPNSLTWMQIEAEEGGQLVMQMHQNGAEKAELAKYVGPMPEIADITVSETVLARYVGTYESPAVGKLVIAPREGGGITGKLGGQPALVLRPESETEFNVQGVSAKIVFTVDNDIVTKLTIEQGGQSIDLTPMTETD